MSEASGHNLNDKGNGQLNGDVYPRIHKLESSVAALHVEVAKLDQGQIKLDKGQDEIKDMLKGLSNQQNKSREANYPLMLQTVGVGVALVASIGGVFIAPLRTADTYHDQQIQDIRAQIKQDHDMMIRMQEREQIRREMGK